MFFSSLITNLAVIKNHYKNIICKLEYTQKLILLSFSLSSTLSPENVHAAVNVKQGQSQDLIQALRNPAIAHTLF